jgi:hypothetical protein
MNAVVSRRIFVGSVASGLPLLAGVAHGRMEAPASGQAHDHPIVADGVDLTFDHIVKEVAAIINRGQARGFAGEDARAIAAQLRAAAVRSTQLRLDTPVQDAVSDLIRQRGRDAVLQFEVDRGDVAAHLRRYGISADGRRPETNTLDAATRERVIDGLVTGGITGVFAHAAVTFEDVAAALDAKDGRSTGVRRVQYDPTTRFVFCAQLLMQITVLEAQAAVVCMLSATYPDAGLLYMCAALQASLAGMYGMYFLFCP